MTTTTINAATSASGAAITSGNDGTLSLAIGNTPGSQTTGVYIDINGNVMFGPTSTSYKLDLTSGAVGSVLGNQSYVIHVNTTDGSNGETLEVTNTRTAAGSDWTTSGYRIQQKVDSTWMGYMQFNGSGNSSGMSFGTGSSTASAIGTGIAEKLRIDATGNVTVSAPGGGIGYGAGAGGAVTQATSKSTSVTLNKPAGQITMNSASLAASSAVTFVLSNTVLGSTDVIVVNTTGSMASSANYQVWSYVTGGSAQITLLNRSGGTLSEAVQLNFVIIRGANA